MASFTWKRKIGSVIDKTPCKAFSAQDDEPDHSEDIDWLGFKRLKTSNSLPLEDAKHKSLRLKSEGIVLAEAERYWEALKKWDEAIKLNNNDEKLYEMKAQAYLSLNELFPAVQSAEKAVKLNPRWWTAYQTLGRTQLGVGEVKLALKSFCKAIHLQPDEKELWDDDLFWTTSLLKEHEKLKSDDHEAGDEVSSDFKLKTWVRLKNQ